jgi:hypothetical protein
MRTTAGRHGAVTGKIEGEKGHQQAAHEIIPVRRGFYALW